MAEIEKQVDEPEDTSRKMPRDILALSRITRLLDDLPENEKQAVLVYLSMKYRPGQS